MVFILAKKKKHGIHLMKYGFLITFDIRYKINVYGYTMFSNSILTF